MIWGSLQAEESAEMLNAEAQANTPLAKMLVPASKQWGCLLTWQHSFAGNDDRDTVNVGAFQPFGIWLLSGGTYLRFVGIWFYDFDRDTYSVPIGLGIGQVFESVDTVYNLFVEPQYSVFDNGEVVDIYRPEYAVRGEIAPGRLAPVWIQGS